MRIKNHLIHLYLQKFLGLALPRDLIKYAVKRNKDKIAVIDKEEKITYGALYERAKRLANAVSGLGIRKGDRLAVLAYNCQEYFEIRIATYLTGIVLVPIVWDMDIEDIIFILNDCGVKALIHHPEILGGNVGRLKKEAGVEALIEIASSFDFAQDEAISYETLLQNGDTNEPKIKIKPGDLASINFSSGTTGRPKGIVLLQKSWMNSFYNYILNSPMAQYGERILLHSISFATAGGTAFLVAFFLGSKNVIMDKFDAEKAVSLILRHKVNTIFTSPSLFITILNYCKTKHIKPPLEAIVIGTEAMPQSRFKEAIEFFGPVIQKGYGMAEVLPPISLICSRDYMDRGEINEDLLLSSGKGLGGIGIKIIDKKGRRLPPGKIGRIALRSASISKGYWNNPELNRRHYKNGRFYTDDFGYLDKSGYLYILGREEDIIKEDGEGFIFARRIEEVLHKHPCVLETCAFRTVGGKLIACVSLRTPSENTSSEELIEFCNARLDKDEAPRVIDIFSELPKNASGKIDRKNIKRRYTQE